MEKVWEELKKIELQAQQIQTEAQDKARNITQQAKKDAEKLVANSKEYAEEESQKLHSTAVAKANEAQEAAFKAQQETADKLKKKAQTHMDKAVSAVLAEVLEAT